MSKELKRIALNVKESEGVNRTSWPVTQGIPFAAETLERGTPVQVVNDKGESLPTQSKCLATWTKARKYVKWLLLDFQVDLKANSENIYYLEYGDDQEIVKTENPIIIEKNDDLLKLSTGKLSMTLNYGETDFFTELKVRGESGWQNLLQGVPGPYSYIKDHQQQSFLSRNGKLTPEIEIEEEGPLRTSICIKGYHFSQAGYRICPYILRIHAYAGRADLKMFHTFIFDQEPDLVKLADIGFRIPLNLGRNLSMSIGGQKEPHWASQWQQVNFLQKAADNYTVTRNGELFGKGEKTQGWCRLSGERGSFTAIMKDCWQEYPKGFRLEGNNVDIQFWPEESEKLLDFTNPYQEPAVRFDDINPLNEEVFVKRLQEQPTAPLNLKSTGIGHRDLGVSDIEAMDKLNLLLHKHAADRTYCFCDTGSGKSYGTAKTHEVLLHFSAEVETDEMSANIARAVQEPVLSLPEPDYIGETGVVRLAYPQDENTFPDVESALEKLFDKLVLEPQTVCNIYGMINYGELVNGHTKSNQVVYRHYQENPSRWHDIIGKLGPFNNEAQDLINQLWIFYLRTGERKYFKMAEAKSEHTEDVDFAHTHPSNQRAVGLMHYHNIYNWSGGYSPSHSLISGLMLHYYLTGNRRALEVAKGAADNHVHNQTPTGIINGQGLNREVTGPLQSLLEVYQATWDEKYLQLILKTLAMLKEVRNDTGNLPVSLYTGQGEAGNEVWGQGLDNRTDYPGGMLFYVLYDSYQLFGKQWIKDWIIKLADNWLYDVRCDDYIPAEKINPDTDKPTESIRVYKINENWYWRSFLDYSNNYFDPVVALAYKLTSDNKYLGYLNHRLSIFPERAREAYLYFTCETFNAINHWGDCLPAVIGALIDVDQTELAQATAKWKEKRKQKGNPVFEGKRRRYDDQGNLEEQAMNVRMHAYGAREKNRYCLLPKKDNNF